VLTTCKTTNGGAVGNAVWPPCGVTTGFRFRVHDPRVPADRWFAATTRGARPYAAPDYRRGDVFVFGRETAGLADDVLADFEPEQRIRIPMQPGSRSLNLSNAVAVVVYEAWRQNRFDGSVGAPAKRDA